MNEAVFSENEVTLTPGNAQWIGARSEQQDAFGFDGFDDLEFQTHGGVLAVLADGMGGLQNGRAAAQLAVATLRQIYGEKTPGEPIANALDRALDASNSAVHQLAMSTGGEGQVGTTLVAVVAHDRGLHWVAVGDSRLYIYRAADDSLTLLSQEHNYAAVLQARVAAGELEQADADADVDRAALTSFLGLERIPHINAGHDAIPLHSGDRLLLCSDGVHGRLTDKDLLQLIRQPAQQAAEAIIASIKAAAMPNQDNATLAILAGEVPTPALSPTPFPTGVQSSVPRAGLAPNQQPASMSPRQAQPSWGKLIIGLGLAVLLVLVGIAIGLSVRTPGAGEAEQPQGGAIPKAGSSGPESGIGADMNHDEALETGAPPLQPKDTSEEPPPTAVPEETEQIEEAEPPSAITESRDR